MTLGVAILAAGASRRMGRPKMLLPWGATSVIGHLLGQWRTFEARQIAVVCAAGDQAIAAELDRLGFPTTNRMINPNPNSGMFSSIQCAARWPGWRPELTRWAIVLGDQPHLRRETLGALLDFAAAHPGKICQPARAGRLRHPVLLPKPIFESLTGSGEVDLKAFLLKHTEAREGCEMDDPGLDLDVDRPEDYLAALELWTKSAAVSNQGTAPREPLPK